MSEDLPEPDRAPGAPHPRETGALYGHSRAEADFLDAYNANRLHHGWLICGPRGVGKATLAWRIARFLLTQPGGGGLISAPMAETLDVDPDHPVCQRIRALSEPGLFLLRRGPTEKGDALAQDISVREVRRMHHFFSLSTADGGRRVVIVDCADELNANAANALLKMLEEPPARTVMLLISHSPSRLLPTIRSRCRMLRLAPLPPEDLAKALTGTGAQLPEGEETALAALADGSAGTALRLITQGGLALYRDILALMASLPALDRPTLADLAQSCSGKAAAQRLDLLLTLTECLTSRLARAGALNHASQPLAARDEAEIFARLCHDTVSARRWAEISAHALARARHARSVNIDPAALVTDLFLQLQKAQ